MSNVVPIPNGAPSPYDAKTIALIRRTVAADTTDDEFNLFIWTARHLRLDPLRRQIYALVYSKNNAEKRRMSIIIGIDGFRSVADRTGNYRPDEDEPCIEFDDACKSALNPAGIVKATVRVWKRAHGEWHRATGVARWDEFVPLTDEWAWNEERGKKLPTGKQSLDPKSNWHRMPCVMIAKVAEASALRKAWPDDLGNVYEAAESDRSRLADLLPSEAAAEGAIQNRLERIGAGRTITVSFGPNDPLENVPVGQFADRVMAFIKANRDEPSEIAGWRHRNGEALRQFWGHVPADALEIKRAIEKALADEVPA